MSNIKAEETISSGNKDEGKMKRKNEEHSVVVAGEDG